MRFRYRPSFLQCNIKAVRWAKGGVCTGCLETPDDVFGHKAQAITTPSWFPGVVDKYDSADDINLTALFRYREHSKLKPIAVRAGQGLWVMDTDGSHYYLDVGQWLVRHETPNRRFFEVVDHSTFCQTFEPVKNPLLP